MRCEENGGDGGDACAHAAERADAACAFRAAKEKDAEDGTVDQ